MRTLTLFYRGNYFESRLSLPGTNFRKAIAQAAGTGKKIDYGVRLA